MTLLSMFITEKKDGGVFFGYVPTDELQERTKKEKERSKNASQKNTEAGPCKETEPKKAD